MLRIKKYKNNHKNPDSVKDVLLGVFLDKIYLTNTEQTIFDTQLKTELSNGHEYSKLTTGFAKREDRARNNNFSKSILSFRAVMAFLTILLMVVFGSIFIFPQIYYRLFPADTVVLQASESGTARGGEFAPPDKESAGRTYQPEVEDGLPDGDWLVIPKIGVRTEFMVTADPNEALVKGAWMAPNYAKPGEGGLPIIIAAHRFGWDWWWQSDYWKYHSFYRLPETEPGTIVELISGKRKWTYEIYAGEEGESISDYDADLILYTCKHLSSPIRYVRYARLLDPNKSTQILTRVEDESKLLGSDKETILGKEVSL